MENQFIDRKSSTKGLRSRHWEQLQQLAWEFEEGNLTHLCNKAFVHYIAFLESSKKKSSNFKKQK